MRLRVFGSVLAISMAGWVGAAQESPYGKALQQVVDSFEKIGATLKTITDGESAAASKPALRKSAEAFLLARANAAKLQPPEKEEKARLEKEFKPKVEAAMKTMRSEMRRVESVPGGKEALKEIAVILKKEEKK